MPKIVNKEERRKEIAIACKEIFIEKGINALTVAQLAKAAGIGKGTIYEYFKNKDDIVFEIIEVLRKEYNHKMQNQLEDAKNTKEKIKIFFSFFTLQKKENIELRALYKEYISINLLSENEDMIEDGKKCTMDYYNWFEEILKEGIKKNEIHPNAISLSKGIFILGEGLFITNEANRLELDMQKEIDTYIDTLFEFIEVKNA